MEETGPNLGICAGGARTICTVASEVLGVEACRLHFPALLLILVLISGQALSSPASLQTSEGFFLGGGGWVLGILVTVPCDENLQFSTAGDAGLPSLVSKVMVDGGLPVNQCSQSVEVCSLRWGMAFCSQMCVMATEVVWEICGMLKMVTIGYMKNMGRMLSPRGAVLCSAGQV